METLQITRTTDKDIMKQFIDDLNPEQSEFMYKFISLFSRSYLNKGDILRMVTTEAGDGQIDSAIPCEYVKAIQTILPGFSSMFHVYDYRANRYGEMMNVAEAFVLKLNEVLKGGY
jgi:hypothetical protein